MRASRATDGSREETQEYLDDLWLRTLGSLYHVLLHLAHAGNLHAHRCRHSLLCSGSNELLLSDHLHHSDHHIILHGLQPAGSGSAEWQPDRGHGGGQLLAELGPDDHDLARSLLRRRKYPLLLRLP